MFRGFLANLIQWILLLNKFICNKHDLEDRNRKISDVRWTNQWNKKWFDSGKYITLETNLASVFIYNVCRMMSSDILTSAQHWIEEPSEIIGEETAVQFPYFGLGINLSRCHGPRIQLLSRSRSCVWGGLPTSITAFSSKDQPKWTRRTNPLGQLPRTIPSERCRSSQKLFNLNRKSSSRVIISTKHSSNISSQTEPKTLRHHDVFVSVSCAVNDIAACLKCIRSDSSINKRRSNRNQQI